MNASSAIRVLLLRVAGTNCDRELARAFELAGAGVVTLHINRLLADPGQLAGYQIFAIPGGFSYGDDISSGKILANQLIHHLGVPLRRWIQDGKLILGICNGFQALVKAGLLPGSMPQLPQADRQPVTLTHNRQERFEDRWIRLRSYSRICPWIPAGETLQLPVAHGEGRFVVRDAAVLEALRQNDQIVFRYVTGEGQAAVNFPENPNGSVDAIAGICDGTGRVLGMMPHPERFVAPHQHPAWTRQSKLPQPDGLALFENAVRFVRAQMTVTIGATASTAEVTARRGCSENI